MAMKQICSTQKTKTKNKKAQRGMGNKELCRLNIYTVSSFTATRKKKKKEEREEEEEKEGRRRRRSWTKEKM